MKNKYLYLKTTLLVLTLFVFTGTPVLSYEDDATTTTNYSFEDKRPEDKKPLDRSNRVQTLQEQAKNQREMILQKVRLNLDEEKTRVASTTREQQLERIKELQTERIRNFSQQMLGRIEAAYSRVEKLSERLLLRLDEFDKRGVDTEEPRQILTEAAKLISEGREALATAEEKISDLLTGEGNFREIFQEVKTEINQSVKSVKEAHQKVIEAIRATKGALNNENNDNATSTQN